MAKYTSLGQIDLPCVADHYGLDQPRLAPLAGGAANSSFHLTSGSGEFVLTILDNHDQASAERLAAHTTALFDLGMPTTEVVPTQNGSLIADVAGRPVILKRWIAGGVEAPLPIHLLPDAGRILATLHTLAADAAGLADLPAGTRRLSPAQQATIAEFSDTDFATWLTERLERIHTLEATHHRAQVIAHGDLFDDNLIVRPDGGLVVLDWETVSLDDPLLDLGMAAVGLAREDGLLVPERLRALVAGYVEIAPLSEDELTALTAEIEHAALIIAFHRYYRHNVRFPDPAKSTIHTEMIKFVESIEHATQLDS
ncbi:phosphotransferase [Streptomyces noursei]